MSPTHRSASPLPLQPDLSAAFVLPFDRSAPRLARRAAAEVLEDWGFVRSHEVLLLVDELVANALFHGRGPIRLRLMSNRRILLCAVIDSSRRLPRLRAVGLAGEHGRGLRLVHALAAGYGWRRLPVGKVVWFTYVLVPVVHSEHSEAEGTDAGVETSVRHSAPSDSPSPGNAPIIPTGPGQSPGHLRPRSPRPMGRRPGTHLMVPLPGRADARFSEELPRGR